MNVSGKLSKSMRSYEMTSAHLFKTGTFLHLFINAHYFSAAVETYLFVCELV